MDRLEYTITVLEMRLTQVTIQVQRDQETNTRLKSLIQETNQAIKTLQRERNKVSG